MHPAVNPLSGNVPRWLNGLIYSRIGEGFISIRKLQFILIWKIIYLSGKSGSLKQTGGHMTQIQPDPMNITETLPPTENLTPNLKASSSLFTRVKSAQSVDSQILASRKR
jgi:hypothetical protein